MFKHYILRSSLLHNFPISSRGVSQQRATKPQTARAWLAAPRAGCYKEAGSRTLCREVQLTHTLNLFSPSSTIASRASNPPLLLHSSMFSSNMSKQTTPATSAHPTNLTSSNPLPKSICTSHCLQMGTMQPLLETFYPPICLPKDNYVDAGVRRDGRCNNTGRLPVTHNITRPLSGAGAPCEELTGLSLGSSAHTTRHTSRLGSRTAVNASPYFTVQDDAVSGTQTTTPLPVHASPNATAFRCPTRNKSRSLLPPLSLALTPHSRITCEHCRRDDAKRRHPSAPSSWGIYKQCRRLSERRRRQRRR